MKWQESNFGFPNQFFVCVFSFAASTLGGRNYVMAASKRWNGSTCFGWTVNLVMPLCLPLVLCKRVSSPATSLELSQAAQTSSKWMPSCVRRWWPYGQTCRRKTWTCWSRLTRVSCTENRCLHIRMSDHPTHQEDSFCQPVTALHPLIRL